MLEIIKNLKFLNILFKIYISFSIELGEQITYVSSLSIIEATFRNMAKSSHTDKIWYEVLIFTII
jgi:hypothetical protein